MPFDTFLIRADILWLPSTAQNFNREPQVISAAFSNTVDLFFTTAIYPSTFLAKADFWRHDQRKIGVGIWNPTTNPEQLFRGPQPFSFFSIRGLFTVC